MLRLLRALIENHPLANIAFAVVLLLGAVAYATMPREQDPEINFNWVSIVTALPGASAEEVERLMTNPLEDAIDGVADLRFVVSTSRDNVSSILVRFREIPDKVFDKRMNDLRREVLNQASAELPSEAGDPRVLEITTSNGFPTATLTLTGRADDEVLRLAGRRLRDDLGRIAGVDQVYASGLRDPELLVTPDAAALAARGLTPADVADALRAFYRDTAAGTLRTRDGAWSVGVAGVTLDPQALAGIPVAGRSGAAAVRLDAVARIERARATAAQLASTGGQAAIVLSLTKKSGINTLELVQRLRDAIDERAPVLAADGMALRLSDDQTVPTREAIGTMQRNAVVGLALVVAICWLFLGTRISLLIGLGIPFSLAATFALLGTLGYTVNISVLLGVVIALGMLVDQAVVVVEAIYYRLARGAKTMEAALAAIAEVGTPVLAAVATTLAAFLPLMLLPGIVGKFMFVIPFVVTLALLASLAEAFWMLPVQMHALRIDLATRPSRVQRLRERATRRLRLAYGWALAEVLRRPRTAALVAVAILAGAGALFAAGAVRVQFFAFDPIRLFYVNVDMPSTATIEQTLAAVETVERAVRERLQDGEARAVTSTAGLKFTETEPLYGDAYGQVTVSLVPRGRGMREVGEVVEAMRAEIESLPGPGRKSFTMLAGGPPAGKAVSVKVRGDDWDALRRAADRVLAIVAAVPGARDVTDDEVPGRNRLRLTMDHEALARAGLDAASVARVLRIAVDGEVVAFTREGGDRVELRVRAPQRSVDDPAALLATPLALPGGGVTQLGALVRAEVVPGRAVVRHHNLRRTITVEADLDKAVTDTREANARIQAAWAAERAQHPGVDLDFSGELEDIDESLDAMGRLFVLGVGLIYLILAAQFRSYWQPLMILVTVPLAFAGVAFGLAITRVPLSLYTLYGVIALTGIAVNSAIVLIAAANERLRAGMGCAHAIVWAARRRVVPILITTATTIGGLFSLAFGIGGNSLLWGPVAASIVWGLGFSTLLTLFVVPLLYLMFMRRGR
ncbi:MAG: efflux RND transporter permease subunit [Burkholderiaceae bacterium]|nr:efflux RND transporter permease subunit [Burkholderiaceae bacterium]